jgi:hypothetical protein
MNLKNNEKYFSEGNNHKKIPSKLQNSLISFKTILTKSNSFVLRQNKNYIANSLHTK